MNLSKGLLDIQKSSYLQYLPEVIPTSVGEDGIDLTAIWNLDLNTFTLKDLNSKMGQMLLDYRTYDPLTLDTRILVSKLNTPYKANIELLKGLVEQKNFWTTLNTVLKNNLGIKFLLLNNAEEYNLENLISSFSHYDSNKTIENFTTLATNQFREELTKLIFTNKRSIQQGIGKPAKLLAVFNQTKTQLLTELKTAFETLQKVDPKAIQLPINGEKYTINQLLQARTQLLNDQLDQKVIDQIKPLFSNSIYGKDVTKSIKQLEKYKEILPFLTKLATEQKLTLLKINGSDYSFTSLIANAKKQFADFAKDSLEEIQKLVEGKIILSQLDTAYQESLPSSPSSAETKSSTKKSNNQNLAIGLGTAGGVLALAGAGGFAYWFLKIRKS